MTAPSLLDELASEAKWLRKAAEEIAKEGHAGWGNTCTQAAECIERHHATIADMAKRLEAAERDSKRLDWIEDRAHALDWDPRQPMKRVIRGDDGAEFCGDTWREQIDAATQEGEG